MRVVAVHDAVGNIISLVAGPSDGPRMHMDLEPGQYVHAIDVPNLTLKADDADLHRSLNDVMENYRVDVPPGFDDVPAAKLIKR